MGKAYYKVNVAEAEIRSTGRIEHVPEFYTLSICVMRVYLTLHIFAL